MNDFEGELLGRIKFIPGNDMLVPEGNGMFERMDAVPSPELTEMVIRCKESLPSTGSKTTTSW